MSRFWKRFLVSSLIFIMTIGGFIYFKYFIPSDIDLASIEVVDLSGNKIALQNNIGKPTVINFWATWCGPCLKEFPDFESVKQHYGDRVNFIMISSESSEKIENFPNQNPIHLPI